MTHHYMENPKQPVCPVGEYGHKDANRQDGFNWEGALLLLTHRVTKHGQ